MSDSWDWENYPLKWAYADPEGWCDWIYETASLVTHLDPVSLPYEDLLERCGDAE